MANEFQLLHLATERRTERNLFLLVYALGCMTLAFMAKVVDGHDDARLEPVIARGQVLVDRIEAWRVLYQRYPRSFEELAIDPSGFVLETRENAKSAITLSYYFDDTGTYLYWSSSTRDWNTDNRSPWEKTWPESTARRLAGAEFRTQTP